MLASAKLPDHFIGWNRVHGAPSGRVANRELLRFCSPKTWKQIVGPFSSNRAGRTRSFEYPWVWHMLEPSRPKRIVEIGGIPSGLDILFSRQGHEVTHIDIGIHGPSGREAVDQRNNLFGTGVSFIQSIRDTTFDAGSVDACYVVSAIERLSGARRSDILAHVVRWLRPGGIFVITLSLFLDVKPFTRKMANAYGVNVDVQELVGETGMKMIKGVSCELLGFPDFNYITIQETLESYLVGSYPVLKQCVVLQKG